MLYCCPTYKHVMALCRPVLALKLVSLSALCLGIYYTPGSLKAKLCVDGRQQLYEYCDAHNVPYKKLGKLLVAAHDDQIPKLREFMAVGKKNGMTDLEWLDADAAHQLEPDLHCVAAIKSPSTGVISSQRCLLDMELCSKHNCHTCIWHVVNLGTLIPCC